jgi:hypothetical protein
VPERKTFREMYAERYGRDLSVGPRAGP